MLYEKEVIMVLDGLNTELRTTKRALWLARAANAESKKTDELYYEKYRHSHPTSKASFKRWFMSWGIAEKKCIEKANSLR